MGDRMDATLAALDGGLSGVVAGAALLLIAIAAWRYTQFRTATLRDATRAQRRDAEQLRRTFEELLAKLEESADRAAQRSEEREAALRMLLADADRRLDALRGAVSAPPTPAAPRDAACPQPAHAPSGPVAPVAPSPTTDAPPPMPAEPREAQAGNQPTTRASAAVARSVATAFVQADPRFAAILQLADAGQPAARIAEATRMPLGEVELVLNLRRFQTTVSL